MSPLGVFISSSHFKPIQKRIDKIMVAIAYTSVSTALNQKLSEKQKVRDPTNALPKKPNRSEIVSRDLKLGIFFNNNVKVQKRKSIVNADENTDI